MPFNTWVLTIGFTLNQITVQHVLSYTVQLWEDFLVHYIRSLSCIKVNYGTPYNKLYFSTRTDTDREAISQPNL